MMKKAGVNCLVLLVVLVCLVISAKACPVGCTCRISTIYGYVTDCKNAGFTVIPEGIESNTGYLDLSDNRIEVLEHVKLKFLTQLHTLLLPNNLIYDLDSSPFNDLPELEILDLRNNMLTKLSNTAFTGINMIGTIDLGSNNIMSIATDAFKDLAEMTHLMLQGNELGNLDYRTFQGLYKLRYLNVRQNQITTISGSLISELPSLKQLDTRDNPLNCDCKLTDFKVWSDANNDNIYTPVCYTPSKFANIPLNAVAYNDLVCTSSGLSTAGIVLICIAMFCAGIGGGVAGYYLWMRRKKGWDRGDRVNLTNDGTTDGVEMTSEKA